MVTCSCSDDVVTKQLDWCLKDIDTKKFEEMHGSILSLSYVLARHRLIHQEKSNGNNGDVNGQMVVSTIDDYVKKTLAYFVSKLSDSNTEISSACCTAIGELAKVYVLPTTTEEDDADESKVTQKILVGKLSSLLENAPESKIKEKAVAALGRTQYIGTKINEIHSIISVMLGSTHFI